jgi:hypothetical protein
MESAANGVSSPEPAVTAILPVSANKTTSPEREPTAAPQRFLVSDPTEAGKGGEGGATGASATSSPALPPLVAPVSKDAVQGVAAVTVTDAASRDTHDTDSKEHERQVYFPKADRHPVIEALEHDGRYLGDVGNGLHAIVCPRSEEHGAEKGIKTFYREPDAANPVGRVLCQYDHEVDVTARELLADLGLSYAAARHRSVIRFVQGELGAVLQAMETELARLGRFFHIQGTMVSVSSDAQGNTVVTPVNEQMLTQVLASTNDFERHDGRVKGFAPCDPQPRYVNMLLNKRDFDVLPPLKGIARQPYFMLSRDGHRVLCAKEGYAPESGMLGAFRSQDYALPAPTEEHARAAMALLLDLVSEFHFVSPLDRSVAVSAMFTGVFRASITLAPGFHVRAPVIASGKSLLCQVIGLFAGPESNKKISYPKSSEEATKVILSALLSSPAVIEFDDMTHDWYAHGVINRLFTSEWITDRILGASKMATVNTGALILGSGNNVGPIRDLSRRVLTCHLDPRCDSPASLAYRKDPVSLLQKNRTKYVGAVLTIMQAWVEAGSPKSDVPNIASFGGEWADHCRHPLIWLGQPDPAEAFFKQLKSDPDVELLGRLLSQWHRAYGSTPKPLRVAVGELHKHVDLQDAIAEFPVMDRGEVNRSKLGWLLKRNAQRIVDGLMFERVDGSERTAWKVVRVADGASTAPSPSPAPQASVEPVCAAAASVDTPSAERKPAVSTPQEVFEIDF